MKLLKNDDLLSMKTALAFFLKSRIDTKKLKGIVKLAGVDVRKIDQKIRVGQFGLIMHLIRTSKMGFKLPGTLPKELLYYSTKASTPQPTMRSDKSAKTSTPQSVVNSGKKRRGKYVFDEDSGLWFNESTKMFYNEVTKYYSRSPDGPYFTYDSKARKLKPVPF